MSPSRAAAWAWLWPTARPKVFQSPSLPKPGPSRGFQAEPGPHITSHVPRRVWTFPCYTFTVNTHRTLLITSHKRCLIYWVVSLTQGILPESFMFIPVLLPAPRNQAPLLHRSQSLAHKILLASTYALCVYYSLMPSSVNTF